MLTPLYYAAINNHMEAMCLLLDMGADPYKKKVDSLDTLDRIIYKRAIPTDKYCWPVIRRDDAIIRYLLRSISPPRYVIWTSPPPPMGMIGGPLP